MTTKTPQDHHRQIATEIKLRQEISRLKAEVKAREALIDSLNAHIERAYRKINHGCADANCKECDQ